VVFESHHPKESGHGQQHKQDRIRRQLQRPFPPGPPHPPSVCSIHSGIANHRRDEKTSRHFIHSGADWIPSADTGAEDSKEVDAWRTELVSSKWIVGVMRQFPQLNYLPKVPKLTKGSSENENKTTA
jgi:hypothetical protein